MRNLEGMNPLGKKAVLEKGCFGLLIGCLQREARKDCKGFHAKTGPCGALVCLRAYRRGVLEHPLGQGCLAIPPRGGQCFIVR